jgi:hypothetical protein
MRRAGQEERVQEGQKRSTNRKHQAEKRASMLTLNSLLSLRFFLSGADQWHVRGGRNRRPSRIRGQLLCTSRLSPALAVRQGLVDLRQFLDTWRQRIQHTRGHLGKGSGQRRGAAELALARGTLLREPQASEPPDPALTTWCAPMRPLVTHCHWWLRTKSRMSWGRRPLTSSRTAFSS